MENLDGKAIYTPKGKAGEYAKYACNFYVGCSNGCEYCYCKKGMLAGTMGGDKPKLKKCFDNEEHALKIFEKELRQNLHELQEHGLFFTFTSDPFLPETTLLTQRAARICLNNDVPVIFLTKRADWQIDDFIRESEINGTIWNCEAKKHLLAIGFTITGCDDKEPNASTNVERLLAAEKLRCVGFYTWASFEPVIDFESTIRAILASAERFDHCKIGLESGKKYDVKELKAFVEWCLDNIKVPIYFKNSLLKKAGIERENLPYSCVDSDYKMFKD